MGMRLVCVLQPPSTPPSTPPGPWAGGSRPRGTPRPGYFVDAARPAACMPGEQHAVLPHDAEHPLVV